MMKSKINWDKIKFSDKIITTEEALKDVVPFEFSEEVWNGSRKIIADSDKGNTDRY